MCRGSNIVCVCTTYRENDLPSRRYNDVRVGFATVHNNKKTKNVRRATTISPGEM